MSVSRGDFLHLPANGDAEVIELSGKRFNFDAKTGRCISRTAFKSFYRISDTLPQTGRRPLIGSSDENTYVVNRNQAIKIVSPTDLVTGYLQLLDFSDGDLD